MEQWGPAGAGKADSSGVRRTTPSGRTLSETGTGRPHLAKHGFGPRGLHEAGWTEQRPLAESRALLWNRGPDDPPDSGRLRTSPEGRQAGRRSGAAVARRGDRAARRPG